MSEELNTENIQDLVFQGAKEAIEMEIQRLYDENIPIWIWRDGKVVDIGREFELQTSGRMWFLIGIALVCTIPIFLALIYFNAKWLSITFTPNFAMLMGVMCLGAFGLGAWYGDRNTRRNCLIFMIAILPPEAWLIYSYIVNGFLCG